MYVVYQQLLVAVKQAYTVIGMMTTQPIFLLLIFLMFREHEYAVII